MYRAIKMVLFGVVSIAMCWLPIACSAIDVVKQRGGFLSRVRLNWDLWWETLDDVVG